MGEVRTVAGWDRNLKTGQARAMRRNPTSAEAALWPYLRGRRMAGFKFRRQSPIGRFIADFVCFERRLIVELDDFVHDPVRDAERDAVLVRAGFTVLRFSNERLFSQRQAVLSEIRQSLLPSGEKVSSER